MPGGTGAPDDPWPPQLLWNAVHRIIVRCQQASEACAKLHQQGRLGARKPWCPNHPEGVFEPTEGVEDEKTMTFPEPAIDSASVTLRLYMTRSMKNQPSAALGYLQSLLTGFGEGAYDADFSHVENSHVEALTASVCLRAMQGYELERLGRGGCVHVCLCG